VMVSDIGLPGEDGYALIRKVREWERGAGVWTPAVALTAYARNEDRMRALIAGYQLHIAKPIDPLELARVVAGIIHPSSQEGGGPRIYPPGSRDRDRTGRGWMTVFGSARPFPWGRRLL